MPLSEAETIAAFAGPPGGWTGAQRRALALWSSTYMHYVQNVLRRTPAAGAFDDVERRFAAEIIDTLDDIFVLTPGPATAITVFRGVRDRRAPLDPDPSFVSCTIDRRVAEAIAGPGGDVWELAVPAGAPAVYLPTATQPVTPAEKEVLLARGMGFRVVGMASRRQNGRLVNVELRP